MADTESEKKDDAVEAQMSEQESGADGKDETTADLDQSEITTEKTGREDGEGASEKLGQTTEEKPETKDEERGKEGGGEEGRGESDVEKTEEGVEQINEKEEGDGTEKTAAESEENGGRKMEASPEGEDKEETIVVPEAVEGGGDGEDGGDGKGGGDGEDGGERPSNESGNKIETEAEEKGEDDNVASVTAVEDVGTTGDVAVEEGGENGDSGLGGRGEMVESGVGVGLEPLEDIIEEEEEEEVELEEEEPIDREELISGTKDLLVEQDRLKPLSAQLQHKIAEYLAKKKTEERPDPGRNVTDQEKRYAQCMAALEVLERELGTLQQKSELQEANLQVLRERKLAEVHKAAGEFAGYKKSTSMTAVHSRTGRRLPAPELEQFQAAEDKKELELIQVRLENIKLQNKISKLETQIKEKEQLAEGLHMIDFEQLKINNVDLNEKIEERNEDILKLRKKVTATVQVLTHVKEKLQFLQAENGEKRTTLRNVDEIVAKKRDHLTRTKQARDALRMDNLRLKQKGGLVGHPSLLGDFEERKDQNDELEVHLEKLQQRHSELTVVCDGLRKKVEHARAIHPRNI